MQLLRNCFSFACYSAAFGMTVFWCYKFWKDEDLCVVDFKLFKNSIDVENPMLSFCFLWPVYWWKLKEYNSSFTTEDYYKFLKGYEYIDGMQDVDFDYVTANLADSYFKEITSFRNGTAKKIWWPDDFYNGPLLVTYSGLYYGDLMKCFGLRLKSKDTAWGTFYFDSKVYPYGIRPEYGKSFQPITFIHLPNKLLLSGNTFKQTWPQQVSNLRVDMTFVLDSVDVFKRRSKRTQKCIDNGLGYDEHVIKRHVDKTGCKPPYLKTPGNHSSCSSKDEMEQAFFDWEQNRGDLQQPCSTLQNVNYVYEEAVNEVYNNSFTVLLTLPDTYKEIIQVKAVDIQTGIGNAGGYVGLFCGKVSFSI